MESSRLLLRALEPEDVDLLYQWENNQELWQVSNILTPFSRYTLQQYVKHAAQDIFTLKQLRLIIQKKGEPVKPIGTLDLFDYDPFHQRAGVGIMLLKSERGNGYALEALQLLTDYAFSYLQLHQLYCSISSGNTHSLELFKKAGFIQAGSRKQWLRTTHGGWEDEYFFQLLNPLNS